MPSIIICFVVEIVLMPSIIICFVVEIVPMPSIIICFVVAYYYFLKYEGQS